MVSIKWCLSQKNGIEMMEPNENMSHSYIGMAEESVHAVDSMNSRIWTATASYYIFYYSLYSLMLRIGVKCEIHSCSLAFMEQFLGNFYDEMDILMMKKAFSARIDLQYYADRPVDKKVIDEVKEYSKGFFIKTKDVLVKIKESQIESIRDSLRK